MTDKTQRSAFSLWMQAVRPFAFSASITPVLLGTALAYFELQQVGSGLNWLLFAAAMAGGVLLHSGTNLISEYFDLKIGADTPDTYGSSRVLVEKLMEPKRVLRGGFVCFGIAFLIGIYLVFRLGMPIVILGLVALVGGYIYTGDPLGMKYRALGEPLVSMLMGPLMVFGSYYVQTERFSWTPFWISIPIAILVAAILNANNLRDIPHDTRAGFKTICSHFGWRSSARNFRLLVLSAYVALIALVVFKAMPVWSLAALITILPSMKLHKTVKSARSMTPSDLATLDVSTAQLHLQFGLLATAGFIIASIL